MDENTRRRIGSNIIDSLLVTTNIVFYSYILILLIGKKTRMSLQIWPQSQTFSDSVLVIKGSDLFKRKLK